MEKSLEQRIARLEQSNRRWRAGCIAVLLAATGAYFIGADRALPPPADLVQAKRLEIIDGKGHPSIVMQTKDDAASIAVYGPNREYAAVLMGQEHKASMLLVKGTDAPEVFAEAVDQGGQIGIADGRPAKPGSDRTALNISGTPSGFGIFHVVGGKPQSLLSFAKTGAGLELKTPNGKAVTRIIGADSGGQIQIIDDKGKVIWQAPEAK
jgi:hypothetical protein